MISLLKCQKFRTTFTQERENMKEEDQPFMTVSLKVDKDTRDGYCNRMLKQALRQAYALKINYSATQRQ